VDRTPDLASVSRQPRDAAFVTEPERRRLRVEPRSRQRFGATSVTKAWARKQPGAVAHDPRTGLALSLKGGARSADTLSSLMQPCFGRTPWRAPLSSRPTCQQGEATEAHAAALSGCGVLAAKKFRTPKRRGTAPARHALRVSSPELALTVGCSCARGPTARLTCRCRPETLQATRTRVVSIAGLAIEAFCHPRSVYLSSLPGATNRRPAPSWNVATGRSYAAAGSRVSSYGTAVLGWCARNCDDQFDRSRQARARERVSKLFVPYRGLGTSTLGHCSFARGPAARRGVVTAGNKPRAGVRAQRRSWHRDTGFGG
jgi:hypothetical protein